MVNYYFQVRFFAPVEAGEKEIALRTIGCRRHARIDGRLQLNIDQMTTTCRKLVDPDFLAFHEPADTIRQAVMIERLVTTYRHFPFCSRSL